MPQEKLDLIGDCALKILALVNIEVPDGVSLDLGQVAHALGHPEAACQRNYLVMPANLDQRRTANLVDDIGSGFSVRRHHDPRADLVSEFRTEEIACEQQGMQR